MSRNWPMILNGNCRHSGCRIEGNGFDDEVGLWHDSLSTIVILIRLRNAIGWIYYDQPTACTRRNYSTTWRMEAVGVCIAGSNGAGDVKTVSCWAFRSGNRSVGRYTPAKRH